MLNINRQIEQDDPDAGEIDALFCEDVLREWLDNLESLINEDDDAELVSAAARRQKARVENPLKAVQ